METKEAPPVPIKLAYPDVVAEQINEFAKHLHETIPNREVIILAYAERLFQLLAAVDAEALGVDSRIAF